MRSELSELFEPDIVMEVRNKFGIDADAVMEQLSGFCRQAPDLASPRIIRCIVQAARDLEGIGHYMSLARMDFRDLIMAAEYQIRPGTKQVQGTHDQVYDFRFPFGDERNSPKKPVV